MCFEYAVRNPKAGVYEQSKQTNNNLNSCKIFFIKVNRKYKQAFVGAKFYLIQ